MRRLICTSLLAVALPLTLTTSLGLVFAEDEPRAAVDTAAIETLIRELGAEDFRSREAASKKLAALGEAARPALQRAARDSKSPEIRWRADQLVQQLRGAGEQPLGGQGGRSSTTPGSTTPGSTTPGSTPGEGRPGDSPAGGVTPPSPFGPGGDPRMEHFRKLLKDLRQRGGSAFGSLFGSRRIEVQGLVLERLHPGQVQLKVKRPGKPGEAEVEDAYVGRSLTEILKTNPELATLDGMEDLKRQDAKHSWPGSADFFKNGLPGIRIQPFPGGGGFGMTSSSGVSITQGADGVTVKITERGEDGKEETKEYKGASLEEIKKEHPEIADKLGGFNVSFRVGAPDFFWPNRTRRPRTRGLPPGRSSSTLTTPRGTLFGLGLEAPDDALASHLRLKDGMGAIVRQVKPGSQADKLGLRRNDIIVKINGMDVSLPAAITVLRAASAAAAEPLTVDLIRRGESMSLKR